MNPRPFTLKSPIGLMIMFFTYRSQYLFRPKPGGQAKENKFYRRLYPNIIQEIEVSIIIMLTIS